MKTKGIFTILIFVLMLAVTVSSASAAGFYITNSKITDSTGSTTKTTVSPGESVRLYMQATNGNTGTGSDPAAFTYTIYKSGATVAGPAGTSNIIARGTSYWKYFSYTIPTSWSGTYTYKAAVTPCSTTGYCDRTITFTVGGTPSTPASFTVSSVSATDTSGGTRTSFAQGQSFKLVANVRNTGTSSGTATVSYSLTKSGTTYCTGTQSATIAGGTSSNVQKSCSALSTWPVGDYTYTATVSLCSSSCSKSAIISITSSTPTAANFNVDALRITDSTGTPKTLFRQGETVYARPTVRNAGTATGTVYINSYIRKDSVLITSSSTSYSLGAGSSYETMSSFPTTTWTAGTYEYETSVTPCTTGTCSRRMSFTITSSTCADAYACRDSTTISHTFTNCTTVYTACPTGQTCSGAGVCSTPATAAFNLNSVWLTTTAGATATSFAQGASAMLKATVRNTVTVAGTERTDFLITKDSTTLYQANQSHSVSAGATYTEARTTTIPATWENGTYYLTARVSPCSSGTCERTTSFSVTRSCTASYMCTNITHRAYQYTDCRMLTPTACTAGRVCSAGVCTACLSPMCGANAQCALLAPGCTCMLNYANVDGNWANGCEVNLMNDSRNCGRVGNACAAGQQCISGTCQTPATICSTDADCQEYEHCADLTCTRKLFADILSENPDYIAIPVDLLTNTINRMEGEGFAYDNIGAKLLFAVVDLLESNNTAIYNQISTSYYATKTYVVAPATLFLEPAAIRFAEAFGDTIDTLTGARYLVRKTYYDGEVVEYFETVDGLRISGVPRVINTYKSFYTYFEQFDRGLSFFEGAMVGLESGGEPPVTAVKVLVYGTTNLAIDASSGVVLGAVRLAGGASEILFQHIMPDSITLDLFRDFNRQIAYFFGPEGLREIMEGDSCGLFEGIPLFRQVGCIVESLGGIWDLMTGELAFVNDIFISDSHYYTVELKNEGFTAGDAYVTVSIRNLDTGSECLLPPQSARLELDGRTNVTFDWEFNSLQSYEAKATTWQTCSATYTTSGSCVTSDAVCEGQISTKTVRFPNHRPTIDRVVYNDTLVRGERLVFTATYSDIDNDTITYAFLPPSGFYAVDVHTTGSNPKVSTFIYNTYNVSPGTYRLTFSVSDGSDWEMRYYDVTIVAPPASTYTINLLSPADGGTVTWWPQNFSWTHNTNFTEYILNFYNATRITNTVNASMAGSCTTPTRCKLYGYLSLPRAGQYWWNITGKLNSGEKIVSDTRTFNWI